jgi:ribonucleoside-triphosphate reductase (thioredoxin)
MSGIAQFIAKRGEKELIKWCDEGYSHLRKYDETLSKEFGVNTSIKITSVKPSGTVSLLAGATPGVHFPLS